MDRCINLHNSLSLHVKGVIWCGDENKFFYCIFVGVSVSTPRTLQGQFLDHLHTVVNMSSDLPMSVLD